jgi:STE24 endopeptidase
MIKSRVVGLLNKCGFQSGGVFIHGRLQKVHPWQRLLHRLWKIQADLFFDTLFEKHSIDEIEFLLAHELGHFKHGHVFQMILQSAIVVFIGFLSLYWFFSTDILTSWFRISHDPGVILLPFYS